MSALANSVRREFSQLMIASIDGIVAAQIVDVKPYRFHNIGQF